MVRVEKWWLPNTYVSRLPAFLRERLMDSGRQWNYDAGSKNGLARKDVIIIERGVMLLEHGHDAMKAANVFCGPGDIIGASHILDLDERFAGSSLVAKTEVHATIILDEIFGSFVMGNVGAARALLADLAYQNYFEKIRCARNTLPMSHRVQRFLQDMATRFGEPCVTEATILPRVMLRINLTQSDIAYSVGGSIAAVESALRDLRGRGLIETGYRWIAVTLPLAERYLSAADVAPVIDFRIL